MSSHVRPASWIPWLGRLIAHASFRVHGGVAGEEPRATGDRFADVVEVMDFIPEAEREAIRSGTSSYPATAAVQAAWAEAAASRVPFLGAPGVFLVDPLTLDTKNAPPMIDWRGATLKALSASSSPLLTIEKLHGVWPQWVLKNLVVDCDNKTKGIRFHGGQRYLVENILVFKSTDYAYFLDAEPGFGIYFSLFNKLQAGTARAGYENGGSGFILKSTGDSYRIAANVFQSCHAQVNKGHGFDIDFCSGVFVGLSAEKNDLYGFNIDHSVDCTFLGGFSEFNHQNQASDGSSDSTADESFSLSTNSSGVKILGGRHIGAVSGTTKVAGNLIHPTNKTSAPMVDGEGNIWIRTGAGISLNNARPIPGSIAGADGMALIAAGLRCLEVTRPTEEGETALLVRPSGSTTVQRVSLGAVDSGGSGYRVLRVPN